MLQNLGVAQKKSVVEQFREFKDSFKGDPQAEINRLLNSGKITRQQLDNATALANLIKSTK